MGGSTRISGKQLTREDQVIVDQFIESVTPASEAGVYKYRAYLRNVQAWWLKKPLGEATRQDLVKIWPAINETEFEPWTQGEYRLMIKMFSDGSGRRNSSGGGFTSQTVGLAPEALSRPSGSDLGDSLPPG